MKKGWSDQLARYTSPQFWKGFLKKDRLFILLLVGVLLVVIAVPISPDTDIGTERNLAENSAKDQGKAFANEEQNAYARYIEQHLKETLEQVEGVGQVEVMVTLKSSGEKVVEKDLETSRESVREEDGQGGTRVTSNDSLTEGTVYDGGSGEQTEGVPYVTKENSPVIGGVVVIASGGDLPVTVQNITEAISALFEIDTHKIKVMKGK